MATLPEPVQRFIDAIQKVPGVREATISLRSLDGLDERALSLPGEFGDLPHAAIRRTKGGLKGEFLVVAGVRFRQDQAGWVALEFLAWWVRDLSRSGEGIQMRPLALPPVAYGTQLGRTLKCVIELFVLTSDGDQGPVLAKLSRLAQSLEQNLEDYAKAIAKPTQAEIKDFESLRRAAENDDASAQFNLGLCYLRGQGVERDPKASAAWFERAATWGHPDAMVNLGIQYESGDGVAQDPDKAFAWFSKAAEAGLPVAMGFVGRCYERGNHVPKDLGKAAQWYRRAADAGEAACQAELGECYELGKGVEKNLAEALRLYEAALKSGLTAVQPALERVRQALNSSQGAGHVNEQAIAERVDGYPAFLQPLQKAARRYLNHPSVLAPDGVMSIGHRPWVAKRNYMLTLYPGLNGVALDAYARRFEIQIPEMYAGFLRAVNGAFCFGMSLCGVPPSMLGNPPLLDRMVLQCHDLAIAATRWVSEYRVPAGHFLFGSRHLSATENVGYFIVEGKRILCAKKTGEVIGEWTGFTEFLADELAMSEKLEEELNPPRWNS